MTPPQIKICGLSTPEAVDAAVDCGATHIGLVHHEPSPRHVSLDQAAKLRARVPAQVKVVLLLVNQQPQPTVAALEAVRPDIVQFHGTETAEWLALIKQHVKVGIWKAIGLKDAGTLERAQRFAGAPDLLLYDAPDNVAEAVRATAAPLVDVSSGVESAPGAKDVDRIKAFCQSARHL